MTSSLANVAALGARPIVLPKFGATGPDERTPPTSTPMCPACETYQTRWRGPHPTMGALLVEYTTDRKWLGVVHSGLRECVKVHPQRGQDERDAWVWRVPEGGGKSERRAAEVLYAIVDVCHNRPLWLPHRRLWLWQPALCAGCEQSHAWAWYRSVYGEQPTMPREKEQRSRAWDKRSGGGF